MPRLITPRRMKRGATNFWWSVSKTFSPPPLRNSSPRTGPAMAMRWRTKLRRDYVRPNQRKR